MDYKLVLDTHTHSIASGHAYNTINEMIKSAADKGLELLALTEHAPMMPGSCQNIYFQNFDVLPRKKYGIRVLFGCELNIMDTDGTVDLDEYSLPKLDIAIASMHTPCYTPGSKEENLRAYAKAMEVPKVNIIGHPDDGRFAVDFDELARLAKENHVLLELNNNSLRPTCFRINSWENATEMLKCCMKYGTMISLGSDAHVEEDVGNFEYAKRLLNEVEFPEELIANASVERLESYLKRG